MDNMNNIGMCVLFTSLLCKSKNIRQNGLNNNTFLISFFNKLKFVFLCASIKFVYQQSANLFVIYKTYNAYLLHVIHYMAHISYTMYQTLLYAFRTRPTETSVEYNVGVMMILLIFSYPLVS